MASENGDPFDGASPNASHLLGSDSYDNLLGVQVPIEGLDLPMPDFQEEIDQSTTLALDNKTLPDTNMKDSDKEALAQCEGPDAAILSDFSADSWKNSSSAPRDKVTAKPGFRESKAPEPENPAQHEAAKSNLRSQTSSPSGFICDRVTDFSDAGDEISIKEEEDEDLFNWISMPDEIISISDSDDDDDILILQPDGSSVPIKKKNDEVEFLWANMDDRVIELDSDSEPSAASKVNLGKSFLRMSKPRTKRTPSDIQKMREIQRMYAERALGRNVRPGAGKALATPKIIQSAELGSSNHSSSDQFAWMNEVINLDDGPATDFQELKKVYKAKRKARQNTLEDDVQFKKAQNEENQRLKRLAQETADTDTDDEAEESDDGLFVPQEASFYSKRPFSSMIDIIDDDDDDDHEEVIPVEMPSSKKPRSAKADLSTKKSRDKARRKEERSNMLAGIEATLLRDQKRTEDRAAKAAEDEAVRNGGQKASRKARKAKAPDLSAKRTKTGRMNNIGSLLTSNLYEDSNANLDRQALPVITEKKKKEFMSSLIANIPLEDKKQAKSDRIDILNASKLLASRKVVPDGHGNWTFKGMKSSLYHYQVCGAACMKMRETGEQHPYGGILADEMGLGKTVQMIATMLANRQTDPEEPKCTLIVCSPALMGQWEAELELHVDPNMFKRVVRHHANTKVSGKGATADMERADIILTTYGEVVRSYPNCQIPKEMKTLAEKEAWWFKEWDEKRDLLHRAQFYRVVLDEAQVIKNHHSQTSIACRALMAKHRWAISGTPIQNRLDELFPYFKFLRVRHTGSIGVFRQNFCLKDSDVCNKRLHSFLDGMMIRRTHQDTLLGAPLMKLPKNTQATLRLKFNKVERHIYETVRLKCIKAINAVARDGTLEENCKMVIIYFQRLRQTVAHIFMVQEVLQKELGINDVEAMWTGLFPNATDISEVEDQMLKGLEKMIAEKEKDIDTPDTVSLFSNPDEPVKVPKAGKKSDKLTSRFGKVLKELKKKSKWSELRERTLCHRCGEPPEEPWVTSCLHLYCKECLTQLAYEASELDLDQTACRKCETIFTESQPCEGMKELEIRDLSASVFQGDKGKAPDKKKFKLTMNYVDSKEHGLILSTKTLAVKAQLEKWIRDDPHRKIIVFTEWLMVMHVLSRICQKEGWNCCHYNGKLSHKARDENLAAFRDPNSEVKVLIASLKCGGTGLNLTVASKVICVDLWFNSCVEQQGRALANPLATETLTVEAFARVHRIGQKEETYITRCVVENTVDDRLIEMQEEKKEIISTAMDDRSVMANLTLPELLRLFGPVAYDKNSKPFILVDDDLKIRPKQPTTPGAAEDSTT